MATVTDDFNRADGGLGANWTPELNNMVIASNKSRGPSAGTPGIERYTAVSFADNQSAQVTIATFAGSVNAGQGPAVRMQNDAHSYNGVAARNGSYTSAIEDLGSALVTENATTWVA